MKKVVERVTEAGGRVVCVFFLVNRNPDGVNEKLMQMPFQSLAVIKADAFEADGCPLCKKHLPINTEVGHGKEFLAKMGA